MPIRILSHESDVLKENRCKDPFVRDVWVYLPPEYEGSDRRYPVLWCLTGFTGTGSMAVVGNRWAPGLAARMDRLIANGCPPAIVAFPDCFTRWGGSQYLDSPAFGDYESYLCEELIPFLDRELNTIPEAGARGVFGKSSGGYGAIRLAMRRPDLFRACACHSGDMGFSFCYLPFFAKVAAALAKAGSLEAWLEQFEMHEKKSGADHAVVNTLAMAAAYSPDPEEPLGFALPFDPETGAIEPGVWRRWLENDPAEMVRNAEFAAALRKMNLLFLDCGSEDEYQLHMGMRLFSKRATEQGIEHRVEEFPDDHRSISYRYDVSLPLLARALTPHLL